MKSLTPDELPGFVKLHCRLLSFPEKLMLMIHYVDKIGKTEGVPAEDASIAWDTEGSRFFIRSRKRLTARWLPLFFDQVKYSSFLRKLYRWGFRKTTVSRESADGTKEEVVSFRNACFLRDRPDRMASMASVTAAKARRHATIEKNKKQAADQAEALSQTAAIPNPQLEAADLTSVIPLLATTLQPINPAFSPLLSQNNLVWNATHPLMLPQLVPSVPSVNLALPGLLSAVPSTYPLVQSILMTGALSQTPAAAPLAAASVEGVKAEVGLTTVSGQLIDEQKCAPSTDHFSRMPEGHEAHAEPGEKKQF